MIFNLGRVPASALPTPLTFSEERKEDWANNQADRINAYIDYLMEEN
jgi:hypothetical protein